MRRLLYALLFVCAAAFGQTNNFNVLDGSPLKANTFQAGDGTGSAPSYSFASQPSLGLRRSAASTLALTAPSGNLQWDGAVLYVQNDAAVINLGLSNDVALARVAANTLALRNGLNAQTFQIQNTYTDAANYARLTISNIAGAAGDWYIRPENSGTGTSRSIWISSDGTNYAGFEVAGIGVTWKVGGGTGNLKAQLDNTYDFGATGANRPRDIYSARHFRSEAATAPTMGACGTSPAVTGSDHGMTVTVGTGGVATSCAVNFGVAFTAAPACVASSNTDQNALLVSTTGGVVTITKATAFTASSKIYIVCMGS